mmetsp:Transcript_26931/g.63226  ORF Transcript_26931/g.63226 Transcript_26931/m.63226 type:complete len:267 (+) Transcript_26931:37-837(+)
MCDRVLMQATLTQDALEALDLDAVQKPQADPHSERTCGVGRRVSGKLPRPDTEGLGGTGGKDGSAMSTRGLAGPCCMAPNGIREMLISQGSKTGLCFGGRHSRAFSCRSNARLLVLVSSLVLARRKYSNDRTMPENCSRCWGGAASKNLEINSCWSLLRTFSYIFLCRLRVAAAEPNWSSKVVCRRSQSGRPMLGSPSRSAPASCWFTGFQSFWFRAKALLCGRKSTWKVVGGSLQIDVAREVMLRSEKRVRLVVAVVAVVWEVRL